MPVVAIGHSIRHHPGIVRLFHGTSEAIGRKALKEGLRPRKLTGESNWKHIVESNPSLVYLTTAYAPYFALQAVHGFTGKKMAILEIETDLLNEFNMRPDEDFIEQVTKLDTKNIAGIEGKNQNERTEFIRNHIDEYWEFWKQSVEHLGNCAYNSVIPKQAIKRLAVIDTSKCRAMCHEALEPVITLMNYKICGPQYRMLTRWFMGERISVEEWFQNQSVNPLDYMAENEKDSTIKKFSKKLADQSGIEVISP